MKFYLSVLPPTKELNYLNYTGMCTIFNKSFILSLILQMSTTLPNLHVRWDESSAANCVHASRQTGLLRFLKLYIRCLLVFPFR